jgi:hypothetical protein
LTPSQRTFNFKVADYTRINSDKANYGSLPSVSVGVRGKNGIIASDKGAVRHSMISPRLTPIVTASVLDVALNFAMIELTWNLTVFRDIPKRRAICGLERPSARRFRTRSSRSVSGSTKASSVSFSAAAEPLVRAICSPAATAMAAALICGALAFRESTSFLPVNSFG